jgi:hypothetical protein
MDSIYVLELGSVAGSCEHSNELLGSKCWEILE